MVRQDKTHWSENANWVLLLEWHKMGSWGTALMISAYFCGDSESQIGNGKEGTEYYFGYSDREAIALFRKDHGLKHRKISIDDQRFM